MRADRLLAILCTVAALAVTGCTEPSRSLAKPWESRGPVTPSAAPATTNDCERFEDSGCQEWTPLRPQPSFGTLMRLMDGPPPPGGLSWAGRFLCGAFPDELLNRYLGGDFLRVIVNTFICVIESADHFRAVKVLLIDATIQQFVDAYANNQMRAHRTTIAGRDAVEKENPATDDSARRTFILGLPEHPEHVLVVEVMFTSTVDEAGNPVEPDRQAAREFSVKVADTLVDVTK